MHLHTQRIYAPQQFCSTAPRATDKCDHTRSQIGFRHISGHPCCAFLSIAATAVWHAKPRLICISSTKSWNANLLVSLVHSSHIIKYIYIYMLSAAVAVVAVCVRVFSLFPSHNIFQCAVACRLYLLSFAFETWWVDLMMCDAILNCATPSTTRNAMPVGNAYSYQ